MTHFIERIYLDDLQNGNWHQLMRMFDKEVTRYEVDKMKLTNLYPKFKEWFLYAEDAIHFIRENELTKGIKELDDKRCRFFSGVRNLVKGYLNDYKVCKAEAARICDIVFRNFGNIAVRGRDARTVDIKHLTDVLREDYTAEITLLDITGELTELEKINNDFQILWNERSNDYVAKKPVYTMKKSRRETDKIYSDMINRIEVFILYEGWENYGEFVKSWNEIIQEFRKQLALEKTLRKKKKAKKDSNTVAQNHSEEEKISE